MPNSRRGAPHQNPKGLLTLTLSLSPPPATKQAMGEVVVLAQPSSSPGVGLGGGSAHSTPRHHPMSSLKSPSLSSSVEPQGPSNPNGGSPITEVTSNGRGSYYGGETPQGSPKTHAQPDYLLNGVGQTNGVGGGSGSVSSGSPQSDPFGSFGSQAGSSLFAAFHPGGDPFAHKG